MFNANRPDLSDLPSTFQLLNATGGALLVAAGLLVTVVLPAEYGVDPTRVGSVFGLTEMGRVKRQLAIEAKAEEAAARAAPASPSRSAEPAPAKGPVTERTDEMQVALAPNEGAEIKLTMPAGASVRYSWRSTGGKVNFDMHGDRPGISYHGYAKGSMQASEGELEAAFDGKHGWFWRNRSGGPVTVILKTTGAYSQIKRVG
ncbi:transmembrane anchor protein [Caulobacter sp. RHG1]|uniref:transmembrane anchor protein n=1 Tax=Caulobacter sp. (strain RHG1) TaxID=2545762 RepID=UPI001557ABC4|nr:transmembrane anchor protein [Caulobacter sp. RHG1]NQE61443.1 hypothetical protein [Caulobacter sp. RHG1]